MKTILLIEMFKNNTLWTVQHFQLKEAYLISTACKDCDFVKVTRKQITNKEYKIIFG